MKVLFKKLRRVEGLKRFFYFLSLITYLILFSIFVFNIFNVSWVKVILATGTLEKVLVIGSIVLFGIWFFIYFLCGLLAMFAKKKKTFIFITIITILLSIIMGILSFLLRMPDNKLNFVKEQLTYTTNLIALNETKFDNTLSIGMIELETDIEGHVLPNKLIEKNKLSNKIVYYEDYHSMISDLYNGKIGACFVSGNYAINFEGEEFEELEEGETAIPIEKRVKVLYDYSEEMENQDNVTLKGSSEKTLTEPFTVLIMGVDSTLDELKANQAFNGDTLILATFNPNTLSATMFSIPRDMYVPIACNHNRYAKINSSAAYGSSCVIKTIQQLTDIEIDYYVKMNFKGVVDLVNALGGVEVDVEKVDFSKNHGMICVDKDGTPLLCEQDSKRRWDEYTNYLRPGLQTLNGEQALAYARNRHQYASGDIARNQHQQAVIEAVAKKFKTINSLNEFNKVLDAISNNMETNITPDQIMSFYSIGKDMLLNSNTNSLSIKKTYLAYYSLPVWLPRSNMHTSALGYYPESLEAIKKLMRQNLGLEKNQPVKTFSISYSEGYTAPVVGKGLTGGSKLELVKSFVGMSQSEASSWCSSVDISCHFEVGTDVMAAGLIYDQSAHKNELVKSLKSITFYISDGKGMSYGGNTELPNEDPTEEEPTEDPGEDPEEPEIPGFPNDGTGDDPDDEDDEDDRDTEQKPSTGDNLIIPTN